MKLSRPRGHFERTGACADLLGTVPDAELAARLGLREHHVRDARRRRGIRSRYNPAVATVSWERIDGLLGTAPDAELARVGVASLSAINERRHALGIPAYRPARVCACGQRFAAYMSGADQRFCSHKCAYAGRYARRNGKHEDLSVALWALRREIRRSENG